jgi:hypothetical protein
MERPQSLKKPRLALRQVSADSKTEPGQYSFALHGGLQSGRSSLNRMLQGAQQQLASRLREDDRSRPGVQAQGFSGEVNRLFPWTIAAIDARFHLHHSFNQSGMAQTFATALSKFCESVQDKVLSKTRYCTSIIEGNVRYTAQHATHLLRPVQRVDVRRLHQAQSACSARWQLFWARSA